MSYNQEQRTTVDQLPPEILEEILNRVDCLKDLLSCRLVCKKWKSVSSAISRRRYTRVDIYALGECGFLKRFYSTFGPAAEQKTMPWSAIHVPVIIQTFPGKPPIVDALFQFLHYFKQHVRKVNIVITSVQIGIDVLQRFRHLENIDCRLDLPPSDTGIDKPPPYNGTLSLRRLTTLRMDITNHTSLEFFRLLLASTGQRLKAIHLSFFNNMDDFAEAEASSLTATPSVSLSFHKESTSSLLPFSSKGIRIRELAVHFPHQNPGATDLASLEMLLMNVVQFLEQLTLEFYCDLTAVETEQMKFPILPRLWRLKLIQVGSTSSFHCFNPVTAIEFPVLHEVDINYAGSCELFNMSQFSTVRTLRMTHLVKNEMETQWNYTFPKLVRLKTSVDRSGLEYIFKHMRHLEFLTLDLGPCQEDINILLTGVRNPEMFAGKSQSEIVDYAILNNIPSIVLLTSLRKLTLFFNRTNQLRDLGIFCAFLKIQPLENLTFKGLTTIHFSSSIKLASYHQRFKTRALNVPRPE